MNYENNTIKSSINNISTPITLLTNEILKLSDDEKNKKSICKLYGPRI